MATDQRPSLSPRERSVFGRVANVVLKAWEKVHRLWFRWAEINQHAFWFPFFIAAVISVDAILVVLPGDVLIALAVLSNPKGWKKLALWGGLGSVIGAFGLYLVILVYGKAPLDQLAGALSAVNASAPKWELARGFFEEHGLFSLALGSMIPFMSWPPVVIAGLSTNDWSGVLFFLIVGRMARYWVLCFGVREGWAMFTALREQAAEHRSQQLKR